MPDERGGISELRQSIKGTSLEELYDDEDSTGTGKPAQRDGVFKVPDQTEEEDKTIGAVSESLAEHEEAGSLPHPAGSVKLRHLETRLREILGPMYTKEGVTSFEQTDMQIGTAAVPKNLTVHGTLTSGDITAGDITAGDITAEDITAVDITGDSLTLSGGATINGTLTTPKILMDDTTESLIFRKSTDSDDYMSLNYLGSGDWTFVNSQQDNGLKIYDGSGGVELLYNGAKRLGADSGGVDIPGTTKLYIGDRGNYIQDDNTDLRIGNANTRIFLQAGSGYLYLYGSRIYLGGTSGDNVYLRNTPSLSFTVTLVKEPSNGKVGISSSSAKYKKDIEPIDEEVSERIYKLKPIWYRGRDTCDIKDDPRLAQWSLYGLLAEDVVQIDPRLTEKTRDHETDEYIDTGINWNFVTTLMLDQLQRQKKRIDDMENSLRKALSKGDNDADGKRDRRTNQDVHQRTREAGDKRDSV